MKIPFKNDSISSRMITADPPRNIHPEGSLVQDLVQNENIQVDTVATGNHAQDIMDSAQQYADSYNREIQATKDMSAIEKELHEVTAKLKTKYTNAQEAFQVAQQERKKAQLKHLEVLGVGTVSSGINQKVSAKY
jgi:hypothetical protein